MVPHLDDGSDPDIDPAEIRERPCRGLLVLLVLLLLFHFYGLLLLGLYLLVDGDGLLELLPLLHGCEGRVESCRLDGTVVSEVPPDLLRGPGEERPHHDAQRLDYAEGLVHGGSAGIPVLLDEGPGLDRVEVPVPVAG